MVENIKCITWGREIPEIEIDELIRLQRLFVLPLLLTLQKNTAHEKKKNGGKTRRDLCSRAKYSIYLALIAKADLKRQLHTDNAPG